MAQISVVFCGTSAFAVPSLEALARDLAFHIDLVITQPDKPVGRKHIVTPPPVKIAAQKLCLPVWQPENINTDFSRRPQSSVPHPDCLVVVAYGQILSDEILAWPRIAPVNLHASLLPRWRGASPIQHAILTGDTETGVTVQRIIRELDAGPILAQERVSIEERETALHLTEHLANIGAELLTRILKQPLRETLQLPEGITRCRKLTRADSTVDPQMMTAEEIDRRTRALHPWPGVLCLVDGKLLKLLATSLEPIPGAIPLACRDHTLLYLLRVQPSGGKPMSGEEYTRGHASAARLAPHPACSEHRRRKPA